ncbi:hypothetical protein GQ55_5G197300 [Panicum hallii var. hallii]|uniref:Uncharacterized protein n=1 Tax=Panicum hallii var. hallii TaxID=1504633 RepID=A0A2T7DI62_9POAL|nr:hypothetical protein GQ55_5G197300 [Panicum hallii var. hallii]
MQWQGPRRGQATKDKNKLASGHPAPVAEEEDQGMPPQVHSTARPSRSLADPSVHLQIRSPGSSRDRPSVHLRRRTNFQGDRPVCGGGASHRIWGREICSGEEETNRFSG